jgi:hypothetical protein
MLNNFYIIHSKEIDTCVDIHCYDIGENITAELISLEYYIHETMLIEQGFIEKPFHCVITINLDFINEVFIKEGKNPAEYQFDHKETLHKYQNYIQILIKYHTVIYLFKRLQTKYGYWFNLVMYVMYFMGWSYILWISAPDLLVSLGIYILKYLINIEEPFSGLVM